MFVTEEAVKIVNRAKDLGKNVCAVGTTVMRAIESTVSTDGHLKEYEGWTNKFIFPSIRLYCGKCHGIKLPYAAFYVIDDCGCFWWLRSGDGCISHSLKEGYRFGTYGDAMLILDK